MNCGTVTAMNSVAVKLAYTPRALCRAHKQRRDDSPAAAGMKRAQALACADCLAQSRRHLSGRLSYISRGGRVPLFDAHGRIVATSESRRALEEGMSREVTCWRLIVSLPASTPIAPPEAARTWAAFVLGDLPAILHVAPTVAAGLHFDTDNLHLHALWSGLGRDAAGVRAVRVTRDHITLLRVQGATRVAQVGTTSR